MSDLKLSDADRISDLEAENAQLRREIELLRPPPPPPATRSGPWQLPNRKQVERLTSVVVARFPCLNPRDREIDADFHAAVENCMRFLGTVTRLPEGQLDHFQERWQERCRLWFNSHPPTLPPCDFFNFAVAAVASGDIDYADFALIGKGGTLSYGLTESGIARAPRNDWLLLLEAGRVLREPIPPKRPIGEWQPHSRPRHAS
jgi:hypothetical protein